MAFKRNAEKFDIENFILNVIQKEVAMNEINKAMFDLKKMVKFLQTGKVECDSLCGQISKCFTVWLSAELSTTSDKLGRQHTQSVHRYC